MPHLEFATRRSIPTLAARLQAGEFIVAPGVYDLISARLADRGEFSAIYMTGYGAVASYLGLPDAGLATFTDMRDRAARIASACSTPLIADADTGYGGLLNVAHTVAGYESGGVQAIQLEDQEFPKKCGHTQGRRVIPADEMADKVRVAASTRNSTDFLIIARTDARTSLGLDEALRRGEMYLRAGADVLFIESPESIEEMQRIGKTFSGVPLLANMVEGGRTPLLQREELREIGYRIAISPAAGFLAAAAALRGIYDQLRTSGSTQGTKVPLYDFAEFSRVMGFETIWAFDRTWAK
jgi:2-methylisocitrate lyase-like PEP mutase family enzyme